METEGREGIAEGTLLWTPDKDFVQSSNMLSFMRWLGERKGLRFEDYASLWKWSTDRLEEFWSSILEFMDVLYEGTAERVLPSRSMPARGWFKGLKLNYAENVFRHRNEKTPAIIAEDESGKRTVLSWTELERRVGSLSAMLRSWGVREGDRVAGYIPNVPEAVVAFLASVSIGAIWSGCSPDLGSKSVIDRFQQIRPKVLIAVNGYSYNGKVHRREEVVGQVVSSIDSIEKLVVIDSTGTGIDVPGAVLWEECIGSDAAPAYVRVPFEHPLWILYSSGTTGLPKPIVHGHGGIVLEHLKMLSLHTDLKAGDRFFWYTTTSWMMWNVVAGSLLAGATAVVYDGSASFPDIGRLWKLAADIGFTVFGTSASFVNACMKEGLVPMDMFDLTHLRSLAYTGSPLSPAGFKWIYDNVGKGLWVTSVSGGTDVCTAFLGGCPLLPVRAGELQCRELGAMLEAFSEDGKPLLNEVGELVVTAPLPSMPVFFWNDEGDKRYLDSYFAVFKGVWRHGDWVKLTNAGGAVIYGRSDSTLKRHGVRIGTSEIYRCVDDISEIADSLVIGVDSKSGNYLIHLFVVLRDGATLDDKLASKVKLRIRSELSPRHVPDDIVQVKDIPRTLNGKKLEVPVKRILAGERVEDVVNLGSVANPDALRFFETMRSLNA